MSNTWAPIPGAIVFDPEKGQRYQYHDGEWTPVPEWKDEPSPLNDGLVEPEPITPEVLAREEWMCIPEDEGVYERWLSSDEDETFVMVIIRGKEQCVSIVYGEMSHEYIDVPGARTMQQLAALVEMLGGAE